MKKKTTKRAYRLRNWKRYNAALVQRGSLTLWVSDDVVTAWRNTDQTGKTGKPPTYSDTAVLCMATIKHNIVEACTFFEIGTATCGVS